MNRKKVCLLTGAGGELGNSFCRLFAGEYHIAAVYRRNAPRVPSQHQRFVDPREPSRAIAENADPVFAIQADLTEESERNRVVDMTLARFGRIDVLVNAAVLSLWRSIVANNELLDTALKQFELNAVVPLQLSALCMRRFWRDRAQENSDLNRNVINLSSVAGFQAFPGSGQAVYGASKAALNHLTCTMAAEFASFGVRVNALAPNSFPSRLTTEHVARSVIRLDAGNMTGKILVIDRDYDDFV